MNFIDIKIRIHEDNNAGLITESEKDFLLDLVANKEEEYISEHFIEENVDDIEILESVLDRIVDIYTTEGVGDFFVNKTIARYNKLLNSLKDKKKMAETKLESALSLNKSIMAKAYRKKVDHYNRKIESIEAKLEKIQRTSSGTGSGKNGKPTTESAIFIECVDNIFESADNNEITIEQRNTLLEDLLPNE